MLLDTSVIVSALIREDASERVHSWLASNRAPLSIASWTIPEFSSALSAKVRNREISRDIGREAQETFRYTIITQLFVMPIERSHFEQASSLCGQPDLNLRAGDALQIVAALQAAMPIVTLDKQMALTARLLGLTVEMP